MAKEKAEGALDKVIGTVKQKTGEALGDQALANKGAAQRVKGSAEETVGSVKDTAHSVVAGSSTGTSQKGNTLRDKIAAGAEHVKDSVEKGLDHLEHPHDSRDIRQVH